MIDELMSNKLCKKVNSELKNIQDMARLHRKMALGMIMPYDFYRLDVFYQAVGRNFYVDQR